MKKNPYTATGIRLIAVEMRLYEEHLNVAFLASRPGSVVITGDASGQAAGGAAGQACCTVRAGRLSGLSSVAQAWTGNFFRSQHILLSPSSH